MGSLKSFIKAVRKSKTIADEKTVVRKESAAIRSAFRNISLDQTERRINISKLVYLYIMGEKTHFGSVECIKLLASPRFSDKRLGYLATMLILDENQEVLTLLTNSLDHDMQHPNSHIVSLALTCLGNIASAELARDLYINVEKIISSNNVYLRKKASIVAAKLIERDPDLSEIFLPKVWTLVGEKQAGILLGTSRLIQSLYYSDEKHRPELVKVIPKLVGHLKRISSSGYIPDYDVVGVNDPFLQATLLSTLRILASDVKAEPYLEQINDLLTQVASNIESGKNAAHVILYECVKSIFAINPDQSLRILGVNLLGKFLTTKDNNTRYVALETLLTVINIEPLAVQRHRATIVGCLSDGDVSIRRRALELTFAILNDQNIRVLAREIFGFLEFCTDNDLKTYVVSQLTISANKYSPNQKWHFDTLVRMLKLAGNYASSDVISNIFALLLQCNDTELKTHVVGRLYAAFQEDTSQYGLTLVTIWSLGEYADLILNTQVELKGPKVKTVTEQTILDILLLSMNGSAYTEQEFVQIVSYGLTAALKLSIKFNDAGTIDQLRLIINSRQNDNNLEVQIRAVEYQEIFNQDLALKKGVLAKMPAPVVKYRENLSLNNSRKQVVTNYGSASQGNGMNSITDDLLLDLMDDDQGRKKEKSSNDVLLDIFGSSSNETMIKNNLQTEKSVDLPARSQGLTSLQGSTTQEKVFSNNHVEVFLTPISFSEGVGIIEAVVNSNIVAPVNQFQLLFAVPKSQKLVISSNSGGDTLSNGSVIRQTLKVDGRPGSKVKLRVKIKYSVETDDYEEQFDYSGFNSTL